MAFFRAYTVLTRWQKILVVFCLLFVLYTFLIFFVLPKIVQNISEKKLTEILGRQTTISKIIINPYSFLCILEGLDIQSKDAEQSLLSIGQVKVNFQSSSLFKFGPVIKEITVTDPAVHLTINEDGSYNFSDLIPEKTSEKEAIPEEQKETAPQPLRFFLANISLHNGEIIIKDLPKNTTHTLSEMNLAIPFISNMDSHVNIFVTPYFAVNFNGAPFKLEGKSKPFTERLTTTMGFSFTNLELPKYFAYNPVPTKIDLATGKLSGNLTLDFASPQNGDSLPQIVLSGDVTLDGLDIRGPDDIELFNLEELHVSLSPSEILKGMINLDTVSLTSPRLALNRDPSEGLNIYNLMPKDQKPSPTQAAAETNNQSLQLTCQQIRIDDLLINLTDEGTSRDIFELNTFSVESTEVSSAAHEVKIGRMNSDGGSFNIYRLADGTLNVAALSPPTDRPDIENEASSAAASPQWIANLGDFGLQNFAIQADDLVEQGAGSISIADINLQVQQFSNARNQQGDTKIHFTINQSGRVNIAGKTGLDPLQADMDFSTENVEIAWFQPFISQAANIVIPKGTVMTKGHATLKKNQDGPLQAQLENDISITDFKAIGSDDNDELFSFKQLALQKMKIEVDPFFVDIKTVSLKEPNINAVVSEDGVLNFSRIAKSEPAKEDGDGKADTAGEDTAAPYKIDQIRVENGKVAVHDRSISPNFNTTLSKINTKVTSLSSDAKNQPELNLSAMVNNHTSLKIDGKINPLTTNLFLDMRMILNGMDLGVFTPYSGKYAGYTIQKGKMTLDLDYTVKDNLLNAKNDVVLDQFDFGKEVKSEDAVNAPVTLAVALLKDPSGRISLDLPITGNLDDPEFSIGGVVVEMIMNLLVKAATAPFSLLGAMFGGGEDLNILHFDPGTATLAAQDSEKVTTLITALTQRPGLSLEISGYANVEPDTQALKKARLERQFKSEKMKKLISQGKPVTSVENIQLSDEEYDQYLQAAFAASPQGIEFKSKQKNSDKTSDASTKPAASKDSDSPGIVENNTSGSSLPTREEMLQAVMEQINITEDDLRDLAQHRAMTVKDTFILDGGIDSARIQTITPDTLEPPEESLHSAGVILSLQ